MTAYEELMRDYNLLYIKNTELRAKIRQQDIIIKQLRSTLASLGVDAVIKSEAAGYTKPQRGRPQSIDDATRQRIKILKKEGLSCREISRKEGVSVGMVSTIINANK